MGCACFASLLVTTSADARPTPRPIPRTRVQQGQTPQADAQTANEEAHSIESRALRGRFGLDVAERLARSPLEADKLAAIARARALGSNEAIGFLIEEAARVEAGESDGAIAIETARALDAFGDNERVRAALYELVAMAGSTTNRDALAFEDPFDQAQRERARVMAALALARTNEPRAFTQLSDVVRLHGAGANAAKIALYSRPPEKAVFGTSLPLPPQAIDYVVKAHDLRSLPAILALAESPVPQERAVALSALAALGDFRAIPIALTTKDDDPLALRVASTRALAMLGAPEAEKWLLELLSNPATTSDAIDISKYVQTDAVAKLLAQHALVLSDDLRARATYALSQQRGDLAAKLLLTLVLKGSSAYEAAHALARSPSALAPGVIRTLIVAPPKDQIARNSRRLGVRAYLVRTMSRGERDLESEAKIREMRTSPDPRDRAIAAEVTVALQLEDAARVLATRDPDVKRAALLGLYARHDHESHELFAKMLTDDDADARMLATLALLHDDEDADSPKITSTWLADRATSGGPDAAICALAFVRRADDKDVAKVDELVQSNDDVIRAHAIRGLGPSHVKAALGRIARAYAYEPIAFVRRAAILAITDRPEKDALSYTSTLREAATLDPDAEIRFIAARALEGRPPITPLSNEAIWIRTQDSDTSGTAEHAPLTGSFLRADGISVPFVFDQEGYAVILGAPPGEGRVFLTPVLP